MRVIEIIADPENAGYGFWGQKWDIPEEIKTFDDQERPINIRDWIENCCSYSQDVLYMEPIHFKAFKAYLEETLYTIPLCFNEMELHVEKDIPDLIKEYSDTPEVEQYNRVESRLDEIDAEIHRLEEMRRIAVQELEQAEWEILYTARKEQWEL
jgi:hypothetical protein